MQQAGINVDNDLNPNPNMVKACHSLACQSKGVDTDYLCLHAQMQKLQKYYIKHARGISEDFNTYTDNNPWYSTGQGTGDAAIQYTMQSDGMIQAYSSKSTGMPMLNPNGTIQAPQHIDAYTNGTMLMNGDRTDNLTNIQLQAQQNLSCWRNLVKCTGSALNPPKCGWTQLNGTSILTVHHH